jgi:hypothetical protein
MPNTLAHIGVQVLATRGVSRATDVRWALAGVVIPDVPWIAGRITRSLAPGFHGHDLWAYYLAQSSLLISLLLCGALASVAATPRRVFAILSFNTLLHLVLDGLQRKWGSGVHLLAPFSWNSWSTGWFDIESWPTFVLTAVGFAVGIWIVVRWWSSRVDLVLSGSRLLIAGLFLALYVGVPIPLRQGPLAADSNSVGTLSDRDNRTGHDVRFDRVPYLAEDSAHYLRTYAGEKLRLREKWLDRSAAVSARGTFVDDSTIVLSALHRHTGQLRDWWNYVGLSIIAGAWLIPIVRRRPVEGLSLAS